MEEAGKSQKDVLELLRSIETVEDLEKNKDVILDLVIDTLRSGLKQNSRMLKVLKRI